MITSGLITDALVCGDGVLSTFTREGDKNYMRFDQIEVERLGPSRFDLHYSWRGHRIYSMPIPELAVGITFSVTGIEGRSEFKVL